MKSLFTVSRFELDGEMQVVGITEQIAGKTRYVEARVENVGTDIDMVHTAWMTIQQELDTWRQSVLSDTTSESNRQFYVEDNETFYTVGVTDNFMGRSKYVQAIVNKPVDTYTDIITNAWESIGPILDVWRQEVLSGKLMPGNMFELNADGLPVLV